MRNGSGSLCQGNIEAEGSLPFTVALFLHVSRNYPILSWPPGPSRMGGSQPVLYYSPSTIKLENRGARRGPCIAKVKSMGNGEYWFRLDRIILIIEVGAFAALGRVSFSVRSAK